MPAVQWQLREVASDFFETADYRCTTTAALRASPDAVFYALAHDPSGWGDWNPGFSSKGRYITPPPQGRGSVREVVMAGLLYTDTILQWEEPRHWAFCVSQAGAPFARALGEDYRITADGDGSVVQWTIAMEPRLALRAMQPLMDAFLPRYFKRAMRNLDKKLSG